MMPTEQLVLECQLAVAGEVDSITEWFKNGRVVEPHMVNTVIERHRYFFAIITSTLRHEANLSDNGVEFFLKTTLRQTNNSRETIVTKNFTVLLHSE